MLAVCGTTEDWLLQSAAAMCSQLPCEIEEEDGELPYELPAPWPDRELMTWVIRAKGGDIDGLWAVGVGSTKLLRRRAAKLALAITAEHEDDMLQPLVKRFARLREELQDQAPEASSALSFLSSTSLRFI